MAKRPELQALRPQGAIRVTLPAAVAYDLPALQKSIGILMGKLGCMACCSGFDITFLQEREFVISEQLEINSAQRMLADPAPQRALPTDPVPWAVKVTLPNKVSYNLDQVQEAIARVAGRLGCEACCSGFDLTFLHERELLFDEALNLHAR
jgi:hypothetical protein